MTEATGATKAMPPEILTRPDPTILFELRGWRLLDSFPSCCRCFVSRQYHTLPRKYLLEASLAIGLRTRTSFRKTGREERRMVWCIVSVTNCLYTSVSCESIIPLEWLRSGHGAQKLSYCHVFQYIWPAKNPRTPTRRPSKLYVCSEVAQYLFILSTSL
jgi:hypothetical protein